jgi:hypothetical protein
MILAVDRQKPSKHKGHNGHEGKKLGRLCLCSTFVHLVSFVLKLFPVGHGMAFLPLEAV